MNARDDLNYAALQLRVAAVEAACSRLVTQRDELTAALEQIMQDTAEHPAFLGDSADEAEMLREGGTAADITNWHHIACAALARVKADT